MSYLMIENPGTCDIELMTTVGASTSRNNPDNVGMFGSGSKYGPAVLLRNSIGVRIYSGADGYEYGVDEKEVKRLDDTVLVRQVILKQVAGSRSRTIHLGFDIGFGEVDWKDPAMGVREFICNAADASRDFQGNYHGVFIKVVEDNQVRAKKGFTRVFIEYTQPIREYMKDFDENFLFFRQDYDPSLRIIPKAKPGTPARVYKKGVLVGTSEKPSLFDYNLPDITVKESRNVEHWSIAHYAAVALREAPIAARQEVVKAIVGQVECFETTEASSDMLFSSYSMKKWEEALATTFNDSVLCEDDRMAERLRRKGYSPLKVSPTFYNRCRGTAIRTADSVLDENDRIGRETAPLPPDDLARAFAIWEGLEKMGLTKGKGRPSLVAFNDVMDAGSRVLGYYNKARHEVGLATDILGGDTTQFRQTILEEYGHAITGSGDETRDLQDIAFRMAAELWRDQLLSEECRP